MEGTGDLGVYPRRIANKAQRFQRPEIFRPVLSITPPSGRILISPEGRGRAHVHGDRCGLRGWTSGKRSPVVLSDASGVLGRFPETSGRNPGGEGSADAAGLG